MCVLRQVNAAERPFPFIGAVVYLKVHFLSVLSTFAPFDKKGNVKRHFAFLHRQLTCDTERTPAANQLY